MKCKAIIFDLDGTLLNTLEDLAIAFNIACGEFGCPEYPAEKYKSLIGHGARNVISFRFRQHNLPDESIDKAVQIFREAYQATELSRTHPYPEIPNILNSLNKSSIKLNVLSNKPHIETLQCIRTFFDIRQFEVVLGHRENTPLKPDPTTARQIMKQCKISDHEGLFIGDTAVDIKTARNANMVAVGVTWGFRTHHELKHCGADIIIHEPNEIIDLCETKK